MLFRSSRFNEPNPRWQAILRVAHGRDAEATLMSTNIIMKSLRQLRYRYTLFLAIALLLATGASLDASRTGAQEKRDCPVRVTLLQLNDVYQFAPVDGGKNGGLGPALPLRKKIAAESPH